VDTQFRELDIQYLYLLPINILDCVIYIELFIIFICVSFSLYFFC
jgi:hypothetical protein